MNVGSGGTHGDAPLGPIVDPTPAGRPGPVVLEGRFAPKDTIYVDWRGGRMVFEKSLKKAAA